MAPTEHLALMSLSSNSVPVVIQLEATATVVSCVRTLRHGSELCPLIHDTNCAYSSIANFKVNEIQVFM
jgi:hypothetical protein